MLGTYLSFALLIGASAALGTLVFRACGRREWSWLAPAVGLGVLCGVGWGTANLIDPAATLVVLLAALAYGAGELAVRRPRGGGGLAPGLATAACALALASVPFLVEGRFGILGTGLNPDMSQHLFAAERISSGGSERLLEEGYPLGPHALVAGLGELGVSLVHGFDGFALAVAVATALAPLAPLSGACPRRAIVVALLTAFAYLASSYLVQGAFKESAQALFVLAFAVALHELAAGRLGGAAPAARWRLLGAVPLAALAVGSIYAYSFPGVAWLAGAAVVWAAWEGALRLRRRGGDASAGGGAEAGAASAAGASVEGAGAVNADASTGQGPRRGAPRGLPTSALVALCAFVLAVAPELGRLWSFASFETFNPDGPGRGNLFDAISPLEALGVWPSGDFRVEPGGGAAPAPVFWLGGALAVLALAVGLAAWVRRRELALPSALLACAALWVYPTLFGTIYQAAKALAIAAPVAMLISARGLALVVPPSRELRRALSPGAPPAGGEERAPGTQGRGRALAFAALALAFALAAAGSSLLVLVNGPVGSERWSPALIEMRERGELGRNGEAGDSTLVVAAPEVMEGEHGADLFLWELRDGRVCAQALEPGSEGAAPPPGISYVVQRTDAEADSGASSPAPFAGLTEVRRADLYTLYRVDDPAPAPEPPCPFIADRQRADPSGG